jgi:hypothetical protein
MCANKREARNFEKVPLGGVRWTLSHFRTQSKVWSSGFYWPEMHEHTKRYVASSLECQKTGNVSQWNSMPLKYNLQILFI